MIVVKRFQNDHGWNVAMGERQFKSYQDAKKRILKEIKDNISSKEFIYIFYEDDKYIEYFSKK